MHLLEDTDLTFNYKGDDTVQKQSKTIKKGDRIIFGEDREGFSKKESEPAWYMDIPESLLIFKNDELASIELPNETLIRGYIVFKIYKNVKWKRVLNKLGFSFPIDKLLVISAKDATGSFGGKLLYYFK